MSLRNLRRRVREGAARLRPPSGDRVLPRDPVEFCRGWLGYEPYGYMWPFLRDEGHFIANVQARQTGKTFNGMAKLLWYAFRYPGSLILVTAPKYDQVRRVAFKALHEHLERMRGLDRGFFDYVVGRRNVLRARADVTGPNVTFEEDRRYLNGSIALLQTVTGNPNEPHYKHPWFRINDLFIPAGLEAGNYVPQTLAFPDSQDNYVPVPWAQYINETVEKTFLGVKREVNHIYWKRYMCGNSSDGKSTFNYFVERDAHYDKSTGVMLQWFYNYSKMVRRKDTGKEYVLAGIYDYKVSDTNLWSIPLWMRREVQIATAASLSLLVLLVLWRWRKQKVSRACPQDLLY